jgi:hypothetical protein
MKKNFFSVLGITRKTQKKALLGLFLLYFPRSDLKKPFFFFFVVSVFSLAVAFSVSAVVVVVVTV